MNAKTSTSSPIGIMILLVLRGIFLWVLIPVSLLAWVFAYPWLHARGVSLGSFIGWVDINFVTALERSVLRPLFPTPRVAWVSARDVASITHRVGMLDVY